MSLIEHRKLLKAVAYKRSVNGKLIDAVVSWFLTVAFSELRKVGNGHGFQLYGAGSFELADGELKFKPSSKLSAYLRKDIDEWEAELIGRMYKGVAEHN